MQIRLLISDICKYQNKYEETKWKAPTANVTRMNLLWLAYIVLHKTVHLQWDKAMSYDTDMTKIGQKIYTSYSE